MGSCTSTCWGGLFNALGADALKGVLLFHVSASTVSPGQLLAGNTQVVTLEGAGLCIDVPTAATGELIQVAVSPTFPPPRGVPTNALIETVNIQSTGNLYVITGVLNPTKAAVCN